jgi:hypothetical protein
MMELYSIIYDVEIRVSDDKIMCDLPFTYFDWRRMELIRLDCDEINDDHDIERSDINDISAESYRIMSLNQLPQLKTILHMVYKNYHVTKFIADKA